MSHGANTSRRGATTLSVEMAGRQQLKPSEAAVRRDRRSAVEGRLGKPNQADDLAKLGQWNGLFEHILGIDSAHGAEPLIEIDLDGL